MRWSRGGRRASVFRARLGAADSGAAARAGAGIYRAFSLSDGEQLALDYRAAVAANGDYARAFALANDSLRTIAGAQSRQRWVGGVGGGLLLASSGLVLAVHELEAHSLEARLNVRALTGASMLLGLSLLCRALLIESPIQRLLTIWNDDNRRLQLQPVVAPMQGGAYLGAQGRF
jgi:hypothetical protein